MPAKSALSEPRQSMIRSMPDLLEALRARRDELELTHERLDTLAGWPDGYSGKLLAPNPIKNLGWQSLGLALGSLGIALVVVEDEEQIKRVQNRWIKRERPHNGAAARKEPQPQQPQHRRTSAWRP